MLKAKIFSTTTMNALTSIYIYIYIYPNQLSIKKIYIIMFLFLPLLVKDCILMYLETTILCIYNFLVLYKYLFGVFFFSFFIFWPPLA